MGEHLMYLVNKCTEKCWAVMLEDYSWQKNVTQYI